MRVGEPGVNRQLLKNVATYITRIFDTLGLIAKEESVGFPSSASGAADLETLVMPHLEALADFRGAVRGKWYWNYFFFRRREVRGGEVQGKSI